MVDKTLFIKRENSNFTVAQIYVDDIVFGSTCYSSLDEFVKAMRTTFEMSMVGELSYFVGLQIKQSDQGLFFSQSKYAKNLIKTFALENTKSMRTPMSSTDKLCRDDDGEDVDPTMYRGMIGSLLYLIASRSDILFSVGVCARYQSRPKTSHLKAVKRIIRYVAGSVELGVWYYKDTTAHLVGFSDSDWAADADDRKSTSGGCKYLGNNLVSWSSKKQNYISLSTAESEYVAAASVCAQLVWMSQMLNDYGISSPTLTLLCDNISAIEISKNPVQHSRTKHIDIRHHFIRDLVEKGIIQIDYIPTEKQNADILTKALDFERFSSLRMSLNLCYNWSVCCMKCWTVCA